MSNETLRAQAVALLNRLGIQKNETLPAIWRSFKAQTIQLLADGYQERFIELKLLELAAVRTITYSVRRIPSKYDYVSVEGMVLKRTKSDKKPGVLRKQGSVA